MTAEQAKSNAQDIAARRDIYYQAFGIYKELSGFYNYGPIGLGIKRKIENEWRKTFVSATAAIELDTTNIVSEPVLTASGHIATFTDPIIKCLVCETPFRADKLLEDSS